MEGGKWCTRGKQLPGDDGNGSVIQTFESRDAAFEVRRDTAPAFARADHPASLQQAYDDAIEAQIEAYQVHQALAHGVILMQL